MSLKRFDSITQFSFTQTAITQSAREGQRQEKKTSHDLLFETLNPSQRAPPSTATVAQAKADLGRAHEEKLTAETQKARKKNNSNWFAHNILALKTLRMNKQNNKRKEMFRVHVNVLFQGFGEFSTKGVRLCI